MWGGWDPKWGTLGSLGMGAQMGGFGVTVGQDQWDPKSGVDGTPNGGHWGHYGMGQDGPQMWDRWEPKSGVDGTLNGGHWGHCGMGPQMWDQWDLK